MPPMVRWMRRGLAAVACLAFGSPAAGQQASPPAGTFATHVIVTAERTPQDRGDVPAATSVLTGQDVALLPAASLSELLDYLPGFNVLFDEGLTGTPLIIMARGFFGGGEAEYVQLLVDGVPVADVESGLGDWRLLRPFELASVEALRGPASALYGDTAMAGVIQAFTKPGPGPGLPRRRDPGVFVGVAGGSHGTWSAQAALGGNSGPWHWSGTASGWRTRGYREYATADEESISVSTQRVTGAGIWRVRGVSLWRDRQDPGPLSRAEVIRDRRSSAAVFSNDGEQARRGFLAVAREQLGPDWRLAARGYWSARSADLLRTVPLVPEVHLSALRDIETRRLGGAIETEVALRRVHLPGALVAALDVGTDHLKTTYREALPRGESGDVLAAGEGDRRRIGAFFSHRTEIHSRVHLTTGLRWDYLADSFATGDHHRRTDHALSPRAGLRVGLGPAVGQRVSLFVQAAGAFKAPTIDQRFDPRPFPDFRGGSFTVSNRMLRPQRAVNLEGGAIGSRGGVSWQVAAYRMRVRDEIDFDPRTFRYGNIGRSRHTGVEVDVRARLGRAVSPALTYEWTRVQPVTGADEGAQLKNIPQHVWRPSVRVTAPRIVNAEIRYTRTAGRFLDDENLVRLEELSIVDVRLARRIGPVTVRTDFTNLTNDRFEEMGFSLTGFQAERLDYAYPGAGRSVRVLLEIGWR